MTRKPEQSDRSDFASIEHPELSQIIETCLLGVFTGHDHVAIAHRVSGARRVYGLTERDHGIVIAELLRNYHVYLVGRAPVRGQSLPLLVDDKRTDPREKSDVDDGKKSS